jgi:uncharacterized protein YqgC (DUF456 family)
MNIGEVALQVLTLTVMLVGLFSLLIPVIPGLVIIWVPALIYGLITGFDWAGGVLFGFITILMVVGNISDNLMMGAGARNKGASWISIAVALIAAIAGTLLWPPVGGFLAALVGVFLVELLRLKELRKAWESLRGMASGCGWSIVLRFIIGMIMIFWWILWAFFVPEVIELFGG